MKASPWDNGSNKPCPRTQSTQQPRPDSNRGSFDPKSDAVTDWPLRHHYLTDKKKNSSGSVKGALSHYSVIFLRHFVVGKNNGGCVSFQTKRAQQVSCLSIVEGYIVLGCEIYTTAPERLRVLNDRRTKTTQDRSVELCKPVLDSTNFSPLLMGKLVFSLS